MQLVEKLNCLNQTSHLGSKNFGMFNSQEIVSVMESQGMTFNKIVENKIRKNKELRAGFQKHRLLFDTQTVTSDGVLQLLVTNSHEGSTALRFQLGFFRLVCANGLVIGETILQPVTLRHTLKNRERLIDTIAAVLDQKNKVIESIETLKAKKLNAEQVASFNSMALALRGYDESKHGILTPNFEIKRAEDFNLDAFTVLNVAQENLLRTGFKAQSDEGKIITMRAIRSLEEQNRINSGLWDIMAAA